MFLACKAEETPQYLKNVVIVAYETMYERDPSAAQRIKQVDVYEKQKQLILTGERVLLSTLGFDLNIQLPYKPLVAAMKKLGIINNTPLAIHAWNYVNDCLPTTLCLEYKPHYIAAGSLSLAARLNKVELPKKGKVWWLEFDVTPLNLEEVIQKMQILVGQMNNPSSPSSRAELRQATAAKKVPSGSLQSCVLSGLNSTSDSGTRAQEKLGGGLLTLSNANCHSRQNVPNMPFSHGKASHAVVLKKAPPSSPESCVLSGLDTTSVPRNRVEKKAGGDGRSLGFSNTSFHNKQIVPNQDICTVRTEDVSQTSNSGTAAHCVVEDGDNRSLEGKAQAKVVMESTETTNYEVASETGKLNKIEDE